MNKTLKHFALSAILGAGSIATAHAGLLTYQGVTFTSSWSGNTLTLEIDAASHTGDWTKAKGLAALELDGIGNYTGVTVGAAPSGAKSWTTSSAELNAKGCSGGTTGQAGSRLCFFGQQIALGDNMVFSFTFSGNAVSAVDPHVKVEFVNSKGGKVGSLLSQTLPASAPTRTNSGSTSGSGAATTAGTGTSTTSGGGAGTAASPAALTPTASTPATPASPDTSAGAGAGGAIVDAQVKAIPPAADLPASAPVQTQAPTATGAESGSAAAVPEPESIALLLGGLGMMGLALGRRRRQDRG